MEKEGLIELKICTKDYKKFFLSKNPFPAIGVPEEFPRITIDREAIKQRFQNVISELINTNRTIITVMVGEYGSGKSHLLKLFRNSVNAQLLTEEVGALAVYVKSPGDEFKDLFFALTDGIGRTLLNNKVQKFLITELYDKEDYCKLIYTNEIKEKYTSRQATVQEILGGSQYLQIFKKIREKRFESIENESMINAILNTAHPDNSRKAWGWLLGEPLNKADMEKISTEQEITSKNAYQMFYDFIKILRIIGISYLILLVDEMEKITWLPNNKRVKYQDELRQMIDDNQKGMCFYFAIAPRQWDALTKETTALVRRLAANWFILDDFKPSETRQLIEAYLFTCRENYTSNQAKKLSSKFDPTIYPFTNESIQIISNRTKGVVSNILSIARIALEILVDKADQYDAITPELIEKEIKKI